MRANVLPDMDIAWRDVSGVRDPGDYPFRDGVITITFAEIAIWQKEPDAQFQLMRKFPLREQSRYALGRQAQRFPVEVAKGKPFFTSSNGDSWSLIDDRISGARLVLHEPNPSSGGLASSSELETFLRADAGGPEHQALQRLMETTEKISTTLVAYDVHPPHGDHQDQLNDAIKTLGSWWHHLETVWIVRTKYTPNEILEILKSAVGSDDQLLIADLTGGTATWSGINDAGDKWLRDSIAAVNSQL